MRNKLIKWIVTNQHSFTIVEEPSFINFIHSLNPAAQIPSADTVKRIILNSYETKKIQLQNIFQEFSGRISFTLDIWTSPSTKSFLALTAHFINKEWKLQNIILDFIQIYDSHTGNNIKNAFVTCLESFSIQNKVNVIFILIYLIIN